MASVKYPYIKTHGIKASWSYGDDEPCTVSTYNKDYNINTSRNYMVFRDPVHRFPKGSRRVKNPLIDTPKPNPSHGEQLDKLNLPRRHKTYIYFGNDNEAKVTAYQEFTNQLHYMDRVQPSVQHKSADIIHSQPSRTNQRSCLNDDFCYFGPNLSHSVYANRLNDLQSIKQIHTSDSVERTQLGRRRKMLTRSMVDYQHPSETVRGNIKNLMVMQISPLVRADSIWSSVNNGGKNSLITEAKGNYGWPNANKGMRRFYKGSSSCKIR